MTVLADVQVEQIMQAVEMWRNIAHNFALLDTDAYAKAIRACDQAENAIPKNQDTRKAWLEID